MRLTTKGRYAVTAMVELALHQDKGRISLAEIAERAEMTPGSVYTWFSNKEELFRAALETALSAQIRSNTAFIEESGLPGSEWLVKIASTVPRNAGDTGPTDRFFSRLGPGEISERTSATNTFLE